MKFSIMVCFFITSSQIFSSDDQCVPFLTAGQLQRIEMFENWTEFAAKAINILRQRSQNSRSQISQCKSQEIQTLLTQMEDHFKRAIDAQDQIIKILNTVSK